MWGRVSENSQSAVNYAVVIATACSFALAAPPTARDKQLITEAMNYNFDACNREDIKDVMKSCADAMPDRDKFRRETLATSDEPLKVRQRARRPVSCEGIGLLLFGG